MSSHIDALPATSVPAEPPSHYGNAAVIFQPKIPTNDGNFGGNDYTIETPVTLLGISYRVVSDTAGQRVVIERRRPGRCFVADRRVAAKVLAGVDIVAVV